MNPSVGDMNDEADAGIPMQVPKAENEQLSWPKVRLVAALRNDDHVTYR